jgi:hypothetical protein
MNKSADLNCKFSPPSQAHTLSLIQGKTAQGKTNLMKEAKRHRMLDTSARS